MHFHNIAIIFPVLLTYKKILLLRYGSEIVMSVLLASLEDRSFWLTEIYSNQSRRKKELGGKRENLLIFFSSQYVMLVSEWFTSFGFLGFMAYQPL